MRFFFHIAYKGTGFRGWQRMPDVSTVQETIEDTLSEILGEKTVIIGCGRTDAEVHAKQYFFHVNVMKKWGSDLKFILNKRLPDTIVVYAIFEVKDTLHARFDAVSRTYDYYIHTVNSPFLTTVSSLYEIDNLDFDSMQKAVKFLTQYNDYKAFCLSPDKHKSTICLVSSTNLEKNTDATKIHFQITANRFLRGMVRIIVYQLISVGKGEMTLNEFENLLSNRTKKLNLKKAYPQGLYLSKITYPNHSVQLELD